MVILVYSMILLFTASIIMYKLFSKKKVNFDYSVIANGAKHSLSNETTAYSNTRGDFAIISREQLTGSITPRLMDGRKRFQLKMKHAEINDEFWYYASVGKGEITAISF